MKIPNIKRININSKLELDVWLNKNSDQEECVMVVTHTKSSHPKFVSREEIAEVLTKHSWNAGQRYTLGSADLLGHVINQQESKSAV